MTRTRHRVVTILVAIACSAAAHPVFAQAAGGRSGPPSAPAGSAVRWSLGLGVISSPRPYVGASNSTRLVPLVELYYKRLFVQGIRAGVRLVQQGPLTIDAVGGPRFLGFDEDDSSFLQGMEERKQSIDLGLSLGWNRRRYGGVLSLRRDVSGHSDGTQASLDLFLRRAAVGGRLRLQPAVGIAWQDRATVDYYYGVRPDEALPNRPAFEGRSSIGYSGSLLLLYGLSDRISLTSLARIRLLGDEITDSPIVDRDLSYFGLVGLSYRF